MLSNNINFHIIRRLLSSIKSLLRANIRHHLTPRRLLPLKSIMVSRLFIIIMIMKIQRSISLVLMIYSLRRILRNSSTMLSITHPSLREKNQQPWALVVNMSTPRRLI